MSIKTNNKFPLTLPIYLIALLLILLISCVFSPLYMQVGNDIVFMYTVLPIILNYIILLFETMYIALLFSGVAYSAYAINKGTEKKIPGIAYPALIIFLKHILNLLISALIDSYIDITFDIPVTLMLMCVDILIASIVWIISDRKSKKYLAKVRTLNKASKYLTTAEYDSKLEIYPFGGLFNLKNPILISIFTGMLISTGTLVVQRLYADIFVLGIPGSFFEVAEMVIAYLLDILLGFAGYVTSYFAASYMFMREKTVKNNYI